MPLPVGWPRAFGVRRSALLCGEQQAQVYEIGRYLLSRNLHEGEKMLSLTKLLTGDAYFGDDLRYTPASRRAQNGVAEGRGPVVSWNCTRTCNLQCRHCYANSESKRYEGELTTEEALAFIDDLAAFNVPVILFTGGEPLMREDLFTLTAYAREKGIRATLSTNGTLITPEMARTMARDAIVFAMANPVPEIMPDVALAHGAAVVGTGRSDFPNQINNVLVFPGLFKGALSCGAVQITEEMKYAAAKALADMIPEDELSPTNILPSPLNRAAADAVANAVAAEARRSGHARF